MIHANPEKKEEVQIFVKRLKEQNPHFKMHLDSLYNAIPEEHKREASVHLYQMLRTAERLGLSRLRR